MNESIANAQATLRASHDFGLRVLLMVLQASPEHTDLRIGFGDEERYEYLRDVGHIKGMLDPLDYEVSEIVQLVDPLLSYLAANITADVSDVGPKLLSHLSGLQKSATLYRQEIAYANSELLPEWPWWIGQFIRLLDSWQKLIEDLVDIRQRTDDNLGWVCWVMSRLIEPDEGAMTMLMTTRRIADVADACFQMPDLQRKQPPSPLVLEQREKLTPNQRVIFDAMLDVQTTGSFDQLLKSGGFTHGGVSDDGVNGQLKEIRSKLDKLHFSLSISIAHKTFTWNKRPER